MAVYTFVVVWQFIRGSVPGPTHARHSLRVAVAACHLGGGACLCSQTTSFDYPFDSNPDLNNSLTTYTTDSFQRVQAIPILQIPTFHESRWFAMGTLVAVIFIVATFVYEV